MIIKRIPAVAPPPPVKAGDKILVVYVGSRNLDKPTVAPAQVHEPGLATFSAYVWSSELRYYTLEDEGKTWCRDREPTASAFRTVVALQLQPEE